jgi:lipid-A-disaccharide synthase
VNIAIFSGEISGDLMGGALIREIRERVPEAICWGLGSQSMREAGAELLADSAEWGAIGIVESVKMVPYLLGKISPRVKRALQERRPDVVVLIDFGAFNVRVAKYAKSLGLKVCYYVPPGCWRREGNKGANLGALTDVLAVPFPWAEERYKRLGANAVYVGHPLVERVRPSLSKVEFAAHFGMNPEHPIIGLLPGSRRQEITHLLPTLLDSARRISDTIPEAQFVVSIAPNVSQEMMLGLLREQEEVKERLSDIWHEFAHEAETKVLRPVKRRLSGQSTATLVTPQGVLVPADKHQDEQYAQLRSQASRPKPLPPLVLAKGVTYDIMAHSNLLLACSGTATLEATLFETPMVILYRGSKLLEIEYHLLGIKKKIPLIGLPNILAGRAIVPELVQNEATPEAISRLAIPLLNDLEARQHMKNDLHALRAALGDGGASGRTAEIVIGLARK